MTDSEFHLPDRGDLTEALRIAQRLGVISALDLEAEITHCERFAAAVPRGTSMLVDLGSGGGLPALVIAVLRPEISMVLVERREKRADLLRRQVIRLNLANQLTVECVDSDAHRSSGRLSGQFDAVTARSFGTPEATARAAAHYLRDGGTLVVSEPPGSTGDRWRVAEPEFTLQSLEHGIASLRWNTSTHDTGVSRETRSDQERHL